MSPALEPLRQTKAIMHPMRYRTMHYELCARTGAAV